MIPPDELVAFTGAVLAREGSASADGAAPDASLLRILATALEEATNAYLFRVAPATFGRFVACRLEPEATVEGSLRALETADLYLACGCIEGVPGAAEAFVTRFSPDVQRVAAKFARKRGVPAEDLVQVVMTRLLLSENETPARLSLYRGTGPLAGFVQVTATRLAINASEKKVDVPEAEEKLFLALASPAGSPETDLDHQRAKGHLRAAFARATAGLTPRDRSILYYSLCDGLSIDVIGRMYAVHRATAARWVQNARDLLVRATREELARELSLPDEALDSLLRGALSRFELSVARCLGGDAR